MAVHIPDTWRYSGLWYGNDRLPEYGPALWYVARCPNCEQGNMWSKDCKPGYVRCTLCDTKYNEEFIREVNEDPDFWMNQGGDSEQE